MDPNEWEDTDGMVMATTVMHFLQTAHNGTIPIMMVTEIYGTLVIGFHDPTKWQDSDWIR